jgi:hypothetical protein
VRGVETTSAELKVAGLLYGGRHEGPAIEGGKRSERGVGDARVACGVPMVSLIRNKRVNCFEKFNQHGWGKLEINILC